MNVYKKGEKISFGFCYTNYGVPVEGLAPKYAICRLEDKYFFDWNNLEWQSKNNCENIWRNINEDPDIPGVYRDTFDLTDYIEETGQYIVIYKSEDIEHKFYEIEEIKIEKEDDMNSIITLLKKMQGIILKQEIPYFKKSMR